jgi:hypothetical protein
MTYPVFFASKSAARVSEEASDLSDRPAGKVKNRINVSCTRAVNIVPIFFDRTVKFTVTVS